MNHYSLLRTALNVAVALAVTGATQAAVAEGEAQSFGNLMNP